MFSKSINCSPTKLKAKNWQPDTKPAISAMAKPKTLLGKLLEYFASALKNTMNSCQKDYVYGVLEDGAKEPKSPPPPLEAVKKKIGYHTWA